jgi:hypothetical protein
MPENDTTADYLHDETNLKNFRLKLSDQSTRDFCAFFVEIVTTASQSDALLIARHGPASLFTLFNENFPQVSFQSKSSSSWKRLCIFLQDLHENFAYEISAFLQQSIDILSMTYIFAFKT